MFLLVSGRDKKRPIRRTKNPPVRRRIGFSENFETLSIGRIVNFALGSSSVKSFISDLTAPQ